MVVGAGPIYCVSISPFVLSVPGLHTTNCSTPLLLHRTVQLGICHHVPAGCPGESESYCPCPDCSKPLIPPHLHKYCKCLAYSADGGTTCSSSTNDGEQQNAAEQYAGDETSAGGNPEYYDKSANQQGGTRTTKLWAMILAGGAVATGLAAGAVAYRKRVRKLAVAVGL